jgi:hypothetical protein
VKTDWNTIAMSAMKTAGPDHAMQHHGIDAIGDCAPWSAPSCHGARHHLADPAVAHIGLEARWGHADLRERHGASLALVIEPVHIGDVRLEVLHGQQAQRFQSCRRGVRGRRDSRRVTTGASASVRPPAREAASGGGSVTRDLAGAAERVDALTVAWRRAAPPARPARRSAPAHRW